MTRTFVQFVQVNISGFFLQFSPYQVDVVVTVSGTSQLELFLLKKLRIAASDTCGYNYIISQITRGSSKALTDDDSD
jgi:hypothetical protein